MNKEITFSGDVKRPENTFFSCHSVNLHPSEEGDRSKRAAQLILQARAIHYDDFDLINALIAQAEDEATRAELRHIQTSKYHLSERYDI